jgi:hypothetical protein
MHTLIGIVAYVVLVTFVVGPVVGHWLETPDEYDRGED